MTPVLATAGAVSLLCSGGSVLLLRVVQRQDRLAARVSRLRQGIGLELTQQAKPGSASLRFVTKIGAGLARSGLLSDKPGTDVQQTLAAAGVRGNNGLGLFVGSKLLLLILLPLVAWFGLGRFGFSPFMHNLSTAAAAVVGLLGPDYVVKSRRTAFLKRLDGGLADALDMLVICSEAGLGLEPAIARVAVEIAPSHPAVAEELQQTASELRILSDRRVAIRNMGARTGLENLKRLGSTLVQTMQYGTPLSSALRTLSAEMRTETLTRFEERAARLPVLLTVPMIVFILPTVFIVVGGPAILHAMASFKH